jgi:hypothetical protein
MHTGMLEHKPIKTAQLDRCTILQGAEGRSFDYHGLTCVLMGA